MPKAGVGGLRSRQGCWTCRQRHKKCDEQRPQCRRCRTAGRACAGYDIRLSWTRDASTSGVNRDHGSAGNITHDLVSTSEPSSSTRASRPFAAPRTHEHVPGPEPFEAATEEGSRHSYPAVSRMEVPPPPLESAEASDEAVFESFLASGIYTLLGRGAVPEALMDELNFLCSSSTTLKYACLAYEASLLFGHGSDRASRYLDSALARYQDDLKDESKLHAEATLVTGVFLCSISVRIQHQPRPAVLTFQISTLVPWTFHLAGLEAVLSQRGLIDTHLRTPFSEHMIEVVGLLDFPTVTIGAIDSKHRIWSRFVAPHSRSGIEPTSGLPRTLLDLLSTVDRPRPSFETALLLWQSERGDTYAQHHLWEAWRWTGILNHRSLHNPHAEYADTDAILMRILASIEALFNSPSGHVRQALKHSILYPLFISSLHTGDASADRTFVEEHWRRLISDGIVTGASSLSAILQQVWESSKTEGVSTYAALKMADGLAQQDGFEIHLY